MALKAPARQTGITSRAEDSAGGTSFLELSFAQALASARPHQAGEETPCHDSDASAHVRGWRLTPLKITLPRIMSSAKALPPPRGLRPAWRLPEPLIAAVVQEMLARRSDSLHRRALPGTAPAPGSVLGIPALASDRPCGRGRTAAAVSRDLRGPGAGPGRNGLEGETPAPPIQGWIIYSNRLPQAPGSLETDGLIGRRRSFAAIGAQPLDGDLLPPWAELVCSALLWQWWPDIVEGLRTPPCQ